MAIERLEFHRCKQNIYKFWKFKYYSKWKIKHQLQRGRSIKLYENNDIEIIIDIAGGSKLLPILWI